MNSSFLAPVFPSNARPRRRAFSVYFVLGCAVCVMVPATAHAAPSSVATVQLVSAKPTLRRKGAKAFGPLQVRTQLYIGDVVSTGPTGRAYLLFSDGSQVRLNTGSTIEITAPVNVGRGRTSLFRAVAGEMWSRLRPGRAVQTPYAIAGVRGTEFDLQIGEDQSATLTVGEGEVEFYNALGTVLVDPQQQSVARAGAAPTKPVTIATNGLVFEWTISIDHAVISREKFYVSQDPAVLKKELPLREARVRQNPGDVQAQTDLGDIFFDLKKYQTALEVYDTAAKLAPESHAIAVRQGNALQELGLLDEAGAKIQSLLERNEREAEQFPPDRDKAAAEIGAAWSAMRGNLWFFASQNGERAVRFAGTDPELLNEANLALGVSLLRASEKPAEARAILEKVAASPDSRFAYQAHAWLALLLLAQNDQPAALREANTAVAAAPFSGLAHGNLALVELSGGETRVAAREAGLAAQFDPDSVAALVVKAQVELVQGELDAAARTAAQAVALDPRLPEAYTVLGLVDAQRLDYSHAARSLRTALKLAPDDVPAASALARVETRMGHKAEAVTLLQDILKRKPEADTVLGALSEVYYEQGDYDRAAASYREAAQINPGSALYQAGLARTLLDDNRLNDAITAGLRAAELAPGVGQYHSVLGLAYEFSGLPAQAERQFREALIHDPQNALALVQLAYKHEGADLRPAAAGFAQGFLLDPAIGDQLRRGGVDFEVTPRVGTDGERALDVTHRMTALDGKLHTFGFVNHDQGDSGRARTDSRVTDGSDNITYVPGPRTNAYFTFRGRRTSQDLGGSVATPSADDFGAFQFGQTQIAVRQRLGAGQTAWAGLFANGSRSDMHNPQLDSFFDSNSGLPIASQRFTSHALQPEVRLDLKLNRTSAYPGLLTLGAAQAPTTFSSLRDLQYPIAGDAQAHYELHNKSNLLYAQLDKRWNERFSLVSQLRWQDVRRTNSALISLPGSPDATLTTHADKSRLLPSLLGTFQLRPRTSLRLSYNQRVTEATTSTFAPVETLLTTEAGMVPAGTPDLMKLTQLDLEHSFPGGDFLKLFLFDSSANTVQIGGTDLLGFGGGLPAIDAPLLTVGSWKSRGVGARYEHQLSRSLFATAGLVVRDAKSRLPGGGAQVRSPYESSLLGNLGLNYIDPAGYKFGVQLRHAGSFTQDTPLGGARTRFGAGTYLDLHLARETSLAQELFINISNVLDKREIAFNGFPLQGRQLELGLTRRF